MPRHSKKRENEPFQTVINALSLNQLTLVSLSAYCSSFPENRVLDFGTEEVEWTIHKSLFICHIRFEVVGIDTDDDKAFMKISGTYQMIYDISGDVEDLSQDAMNDFATFNASYNAFPYFRELLDNTAWRMGISPLLLPLLKPSQIGQKRISVKIEGKSVMPTLESEYSKI